MLRKDFHMQKKLREKYLLKLAYKDVAYASNRNDGAYV